MGGWPEKLGDGMSLWQNAGAVAAQQPRRDSAAKSQRAPTPPTRPVATGSVQSPRAEKGGGESAYWPPSAEWALVVVTIVLALYTYRLFRATKDLAIGATKDAAEVRKVMGGQQAAMEIQANAMREQ